MSVGQRTVSHCTLVFPGLLGPAVPVEELPGDAWPSAADLPCLSRLLRRGKHQTRSRQSLEYQLLSHLGLTTSADAELPVARLRTHSITGHETTSLWCLDPVHVQIDREMAYLVQPDSLRLTETEARELIAGLNAHFGDELQIHYYSPQQWLVEMKIEVSTKTPTQALGRNVQHVQASGRDARRWRTLLNEIQMLLHANPVNVAREEAGDLPVNSLWLWGGGELANPATSIDVVYANDALSVSAATQAAIAHHALPASLSDATLAEQNSLLVLTFQLDAIRRKDVYAWLDSLRILEQDYLAPLCMLLRRGELSGITLESDTLELALDKARLGRWWQRPGLFANAIIGLRERYGY